MPLSLQLPLEHLMLHAALPTSPDPVIPPVLRAGYPNRDPAAADPEAEDVLSLDASSTLEFVVAQQQAVDAAEAAKLRAAAHWADLHRVDLTCEVGAVDPDIARTFGAGEGVRGRESELRLAGQG